MYIVKPTSFCLQLEKTFSRKNEAEMILDYCPQFETKWITFSLFAQTAVLFLPIVHIKRRKKKNQQTNKSTKIGITKKKAKLLVVAYFFPQNLALLKQHNFLKLWSSISTFVLTTKGFDNSNNGTKKNCINNCSCTIVSKRFNFLKGIINDHFFEREVEKIRGKPKDVLLIFQEITSTLTDRIMEAFVVQRK